MDIEKIYFNLDLTLTRMQYSFDDCFVKAMTEEEVPEAKINPEEYYKDYFLKYFKNLKKNPRSKAMKEYFQDYNIERNPKTVSDLYKKVELGAVAKAERQDQILRKLANEFKLGIVTAGTTKLQKKKIEKLNLDQFFSEVFITYEEGMKKEEILQKLSQKTEGELVYVSNSDSDLRKAKEAGWKTADLDIVKLQQNPLETLKGAIK